MVAFDQLKMQRLVFAKNRERERDGGRGEGENLSFLHAHNRGMSGEETDSRETNIGIKIIIKIHTSNSTQIEHHFIC